MDNYMELALQLAEKGRGYTRPNPMVGAVIVKDGKIVGQGWHQQAGCPHAEIYAIAQAGESARGATLYVTLEPCAHYGRTGPCTQAIINAGITKVVVAMVDPNPLVAGKGIKTLAQAGIQVEVVKGVLNEQAVRLNEKFIKWITAKMPFVAIKTAMSLDGKIATYCRKSKWITGEQARNYGHYLRHCYDSILVGIGTVVDDDPLLTCRLPDGRSPIRIVVDSMARISLSAKVVQDNSAPTIIAVSKDACINKIEKLKAVRAGITVIEIQRNEHGLELQDLMRKLAAMNITSVLVEGGASINASLLKAKIVDKYYCFIAPKLIGGIEAMGPVGGQGVDCPDAAWNVDGMNIEQIGEDILISGYIRK